MTFSAIDAKRIYDQAEQLYSDSEVDAAIDTMAEKLDALLEQDESSEILALCVMTGAVILAGQLLTRLSTILRLNYLHASRYRGNTVGSDIEWLKQQESPLAGQTVVVIDDILDEGYTLKAIVENCRSAGAGRIISVVLTEKHHDRGCGFKADIVGLTVPDRYVFGYGMDYKGYLRNAPGIFAVTEAHA